MSEKTTPTIAPDPLENIVKLPKEWPYRLAGSLVLLSVIAVLVFLTITVKESLVSKKFDAWREDFYDFTGTIGFTVDDIVISGLGKTGKDDVTRILGLSRQDNILKVDVAKIKKKLEKLPWVKKAYVKKTFLPNVVTITIHERKVQSIWQISEKFYPIDTDGNVIEAEFKPTRPILLIVGKDAPRNINGLLNIIKNDKAVFERVKVANYISQRRWNLVLDDIREGITIKLPEDNIEQAWKKLLKLNTTKGILKRKLTIIDLRLPDKVIVKLKKAASDEPLKLNNGKERNI